MSKFKAIDTGIEGLIVVEPTVFGDSRGFFFESYSERDFEQIGIQTKFVQDNHSRSRRGVLRGLHFQSQSPQAKLIRVVVGAVVDVAVDLRPESATFGRWFSVVLSAENKRQLFVPERFAHGFLTLEDNTEFVYKCSDYYRPEFDGGVIWNDPKIAIEWNLEAHGLTQNDLLLSEKDSKQPLMESIDWNILWR